MGTPKLQVIGLKGEKGDKGDKGDPYTLTDADKETIVAEVLNEMPSGFDTTATFILDCGDASGNSLIG